MFKMFNKACKCAFSAVATFFSGVEQFSAAFEELGQWTHDEATATQEGGSFTAHNTNTTQLERVERY